MSSHSDSVSRYTWASLALLIGVSAAGCAIPEERREAFTVAVEAQEANRHDRAAAAAARYLKGATADDPRYDRALVIMGRACEGMGLTYAASVLYRDVAMARRNMELLPDALRGLRRIVESGAYDDDLIIRGYLAGSEFTGLPDDVQGFVSYNQGLDSIRNGFDEWGEQQFDRIPVESEYHWRAVYVFAVRAIARNEVEPARELLEWMLEQADPDARHEDLFWMEHYIVRTHHNPRVPEDLRVEIHRTLARLAFEERRFEEAMVHYDAIRELAPYDPEILLETAWTYFYLGDSRQALGRLIALDAPVHSTYIAPERYVLEAFCLRRLCQFGPARQAAVRLWDRHGDALADLLAGTPLTESVPLRAAARRRPGAIATARYLRRLTIERAMMRSMSRSLGQDLMPRLERIYERGIAEAEVREAEVLEDEARGLAAELLDAEEGVRLVVHELSVSMLRGRRRPDGPAERPVEPIPTWGDQVFYQFTGEFWTDELDDLVVRAEDRCID